MSNDEGSPKLKDYFTTERRFLRSFGISGSFVILHSEFVIPSVSLGTWRRAPLRSAPVRSPVYTASRLLTKALLTPFVRIRALRPEATDREGPWILAANHISHFDPPLIGVAIQRKVDWMAMAELFEHPVAAAWLRSIDTFPVDRSKVDRRAVRTALERLERGHVIGMFPEGGIRDGAHSVLEGAPMRPGVGALAQMSGAPVIPCVIIGSDRLYAHRSWAPLRQTQIWISFGEAMSCERPGKGARQSFEQELSEVFRRTFKEMQERFGLTADDLPQPPLRRKGRV